MPSRYLAVAGIPANYCLTLLLSFLFTVVIVVCYEYYYCNFLFFKLLYPPVFGYYYYNANSRLTLKVVMMGSLSLHSSFFRVMLTRFLDESTSSMRPVTSWPSLYLLTLRLPTVLAM